MSVNQFLRQFWSLVYTTGMKSAYDVFPTGSRSKIHQNQGETASYGQSRINSYFLIFFYEITISIFCKNQRCHWTLRKVMAKFLLCGQLNGKGATHSLPVKEMKVMLEIKIKIYGSTLASKCMTYCFSHRWHTSHFKKSTEQCRRYRMNFEI